MKKAFVLLFVSVFMLVGCSDSEKEPKEKTNEAETVQAESESETENSNGDANKENEIYSDEVKDFVESFNNLASLEDEMELLNVEPAEENEEGYSQVLYSSKDYVITTTYDKNGEVKSYTVLIADSQPYRELKGNGLYALLHVGSALKLDIEELSKEFEEALPSHAGLYKDGDYTITFSANNEVPEIGMIIMFMNLTE
jgi:TolA-binding protein